MSIVPIRGLFEAHLTVSDLDRSIAFYRDVLGLPLAHRVPERQVAFFWVPSSDKAMLGLWSIGTSPLRLRLHIAFDVALPQVFESVAALRRAGIKPRSGTGESIDEPVVLTWMPDSRTSRSRSVKRLSSVVVTWPRPMSIWFISREASLNT